MPLHTEEERRKNRDRAASKNGGQSVKPGSPRGGRTRRTRIRPRIAVRRRN